MCKFNLAICLNALINNKRNSLFFVNHIDSSSSSGSPGFGASMQISWIGRVTAGSRTTFTCSSSCFPNCVYSWNFNGRTVNGSTLSWTPNGQDVSVELQCIVYNNKTGITSSTTTIVEIWSKYSIYNHMVTKCSCKNYT